MQPLGDPDVVLLREVGAPAQVRALRRRQVRSDLVRSHPGVLRRVDSDDPLISARAALAWAGPAAALSGLTAAAVHGLPLMRAPSTVELTIPATRRLRSATVTVRRSTLRPDQTTRCRGLLVTSLARTVTDCCLRLPLAEAVAVADCALRLGLVSKAELHAEVSRMSGSPGARAVRRVVELADAAAENLFESVGRVVLIEGGLPRPLLQVMLGDAMGHVLRADALIDNVVIEFDGRLAHEDSAAFQHDRDVANRLAAMGCTLLRFTWADVMRRPAWVVQCVRAALQGAAQR